LIQQCLHRRTAPLYELADYMSEWLAEVICKRSGVYWRTSSCLLLLSCKSALLPKARNYTWLEFASGRASGLKTFAAKNSFQWEGYVGNCLTPPSIEKHMLIYVLSTLDKLTSLPGMIMKWLACQTHNTEILGLILGNVKCAMFNVEVIYSAPPTVDWWRITVTKVLFMLRAKQACYPLWVSELVPVSAVINNLHLWIVTLWKVELT
jgi:hypothetical protein